MLINESGIDTAVALEIYKIANIMANKRAEAQAIANTIEGKKPKANIIGAVEIQNELVPLLEPIIFKFGVDNLDKYYDRVIDWDVSNLTPKMQSDCAALQTVIMGLLVNYKNNIELYKNHVARYQKSIDETLKRKNEEVSIKYRDYLSNKISAAIRKITDEKTLKSLYGEMTHSSYEDKSTSDMQDIISKKLKECSTEEGQIENLKTQNLLSIGTLQLIKKHEVMVNAVKILKGEYTPKQLDNFYDHLKANKDTLTVSRKESGFKTFLKGLGVVGATIFGLGVGGYLAYQGLFNNSNGKEYIKDINQTYNKIAPAA